MLNVGIKTQTPSTIDDKSTNNVEKRRDFYNIASIHERLINLSSNLVHVFMGSTNEDMYTVTYQYVDGTSENAPVLPYTTSYPKGANVEVSLNPYFEGYSFNGWTSDDVVITNGTFEMPNKNIVIKGSFSQTTPHQVTYSIDSEIPSGYVLPSAKNYYPNSLVYLDSLKEGDIINGYKFLGWSSNDVNITYNSFEMINSDVSIVGRFAPVTYSVNYEFIGNVMPDNSNSLLPNSSTYSEGDIVVLSSVADVPGYKFLGWFKDDGFTMPNKNVTVYGEWKRFAGYFEPSITMEAIDGKDSYQLNDEISYKITVTNNSNFPIKNVIIKGNNSLNFITGSGYTIQNNLATINEIGANSTKTVYAKYIVKSEDNNTVTNEIELRSATSDNDYELKEQDYKVSVTSNIKPKLQICVNVSGLDLNKSFIVKISNNTYEYSSYLKKNECITHYLNPGTYNISEVIPQEYNLNSVTGNINSNNQTLTIVNGNNYQINFNNKFKNKKFMHSYGDVVNTVEGGQ